MTLEQAAREVVEASRKGFYTGGMYDLIEAIKGLEQALSSPDESRLAAEKPKCDEVDQKYWIAEDIINKLFDDLNNRKGFEVASLDVDTQEEIRASWWKIIEQHLQQKGGQR